MMIVCLRSFIVFGKNRQATFGILSIPYLDLISLIAIFGVQGSGNYTKMSKSSHLRGSNDGTCE